MTHRDPTDMILIDRYVSGDNSALATLVKRWHKIFCEKAYWILQDRVLSKDVAQECWIIIINKLHTLKNTESFKSWSMKIVYTKSIDAHNRRIKESQTSNIAEHRHQSDANETEDKAALETKLRSAIQELSANKQHIIRLFYVQEYSLKEISIFLDIPLGTAKSRLFKAREKLKSILKP